MIRPCHRSQPNYNWFKILKVKKISLPSSNIIVYFSIWARLVVGWCVRPLSSKRPDIFHNVSLRDRKLSFFSREHRHVIVGGWVIKYQITSMNYNACWHEDQRREDILTEILSGHHMDTLVVSGQSLIQYKWLVFPENNFQ